jgi:hypothetical protein
MKFVHMASAVSCLSESAYGQQTSTSGSGRYNIPVKGTILVAFVIADDAVTIDFTGRWERVGL